MGMEQRRGLKHQVGSGIARMGAGPVSYCGRYGGTTL
jgi:hypothetical protein